MTDKTYTPPPVAWRLPVFVEATVDDLKKSQVSCPTCPVFLQCQANDGGTGWVCPICNATGVFVSDYEPGKLPPDLLIVDCGKHQFNRKSATEQMTKCGLCGGGQMELEIRFPKNRAHYLVTEYMKVPIEERQRFLKEKLEYWKNEYAKEPEESKS